MPENIAVSVDVKLNMKNIKSTVMQIEKALIDDRLRGYYEIGWLR